MSCADAPPAVTHTLPDAGPDPYDASPYVPQRGGLPAHRRAAAVCRGCPLFEHATQTVFGKGDPSARIVVVGEQPGDQEDRQGEPFVGPAGRLLRKALREAGIDVDAAYLTNVVKHFKFSQEGPGKRRIHKAPSLREMSACRPWLIAELHLVRPDVVVALGATAGKALVGGSFRVTRDRGALIPMADEDGGRHVVATIHPSAVLRANDREAAYAGLLADLKVAAKALE
ncbi:UdgX family uracil-DNA binding protein [Streptomyces mirabilis]|uniref:UdgX family uracil-DNA binding protein n=1 Tax=Streptomyces mirabilis TaxID=68239 RepID=UPI0036CE8D8F